MANYGIGPTLVGITELSALATPVDPPIITDIVYDLQQLGNGQYEEIGLGKQTWLFRQMTFAQLAMMLSFISGPSSAVFVRTVPDRSAAFTYGNYSAVILRPVIPADSMMAGLAENVKFELESMEAAS